MEQQDQEPCNNNNSIKFNSIAMEIKLFFSLWFFFFFNSPPSSLSSFSHYFQGSEVKCVFAFSMPLLPSSFARPYKTPCKSVNIFELRRQFHSASPQNTLKEFQIVKHGWLRKYSIRKWFLFFQKKRTNGNFTHIADLMCDASRAHLHTNQQN